MGNFRIFNHDYLLLLITLLSLIAAVVVDSILPPEIVLTTLYAVPIFVAAYRFRPFEISLVALVSVALYTFQATDIDHASVVNVILKDLSFIILTILAMEFSRQRHRTEAHRQKALQARHELELFMHMISHDLLQPVTSGKLYLTLLARNRSPKIKSMTQKLIGVFDQLQILVKDLGDTAQIQNGQLSYRPRYSNLSALITDVVEVYRHTQSNHILTIDHLQAIWGNFDQERIRQVLDNLISNAIKYSPQGGQIYLTCEKKRNFVVITVQDNGLGMTPEQRRNLFRPFARQHASHNIAGTGLGLFITKSIVESHHGSIWVNSQSGKGSTFFVKLPLTQKSNKTIKTKAI